jgi:predicted dehydrogenase
MNSTRRRFLKTAAATAAAPFILPSHIWAAETKPSDRIGTALIGMGKMARGHLGNLSWRTQLRAICDVDTTRREDGVRRANEFYTKNPDKGAADVAGVKDFREVIARKDVDAVCIATPDHWHAMIALEALKAGKDVYCEKPLTQTIREAAEIMRTVKAHGRVFQTGSQQRSSTEFRVACELIRNGAIGTLRRVECSFGDPGVPCDLPGEPEEPGLDWDLWLGPAPRRPYNAILSPRGLHDHFPHWREYREFGGGAVTDWGAHHLDIAQWALGMDDSGPVEVRPPEKPGDTRGAKLVYANGVTVEHKNGFGVHFFGDNGEIKVNRGKFEFIHNGRVVASATGGKQEKTSCAAEVAKAEREFLSDAKIRLYNSKSHIDDFLERMRDRQKPIASETVGARSVICCHLMNLAYYHGRPLRWDPAALNFAGGTGDPAWLTREYRAPWRV